MPTDETRRKEGCWRFAKGNFGAVPWLHPKSKFLAKGCALEIPRVQKVGIMTFASTVINRVSQRLPTKKREQNLRF
jgi:hypothetical protein